MSSYHLRRIRPYAIRAARQTDLDAIVALESRCFPKGHYGRRSLAFHIDNPKSAVIVARVDGVARGFALVRFRSNSSCGRLMSLAVAPAFRGMGLGSALLAAAERACQQRGFQGLRLEARQYRLSFYMRQGYRIFGALAAYYADGRGARQLEKLFMPATRLRA
jgi:ribosomal protein S18 acetylase RimI-like enzyme